MYAWIAENLRQAVRISADLGGCPLDRRPLMQARILHGDLRVHYSDKRPVEEETEERPGSIFPFFICGTCLCVLGLPEQNEPITSRISALQRMFSLRRRQDRVLFP